MSGHRQSWRSPNASTSRRNNSCYHTSTSTSTKDDERDVRIHNQRRLKRSSASLSLASPASHLNWVILSQKGARRDGFHSDRTSSATTLTSNGEKISVSLELVEPPGISVLSLDWPEGTGRNALTCPEIIAAHRDVVLLKMSRADSNLDDYFVYQASSDISRRPSLLLLLPTARYGEEERSLSGWSRKDRQVLMRRDDTGIMSGTGVTPRRSEDDPSSFVVARLMINQSRTMMCADEPPEIEARLFRSGSHEWKLFQDLHVHGANGGRDLHWWCTNAILTYRRRFLIWVDYYRGMILADMLMELEKDAVPPMLRYVPLPVDKVSGNTDHFDFGRGFPEGYRCVCATRHGIKFVSVDHKHTSNWGVGHTDVLTWNHTFRITTWSLREDDYTWRRDATMYEEEFWDALGSRDHSFPRVAPQFPVVNMDNPDAVCFRLKMNHYCYEEPTWMIEVDMKKKVLLAATSYSMERSSGGDANEGSIDYARVTSSHAVPFSSDLPRYLDGELEECKKRRQ